VTSPAPPSTSGRPAARPGEQALRRFAERRRRWWLWYAVALVGVGVLVVAGLALAWFTGEAAHAHLHTAAQPAPALARSALPARLSVGWTSTDVTAIGEPLFSGTVITYSAHTVSGRDARTGAVTWSYTRTNATVCQVAQEQGKTLALFAPSGSCDELSAFDTGTGARVWQRTLDENMTPVTGDPAVIVLPDTFLVWTPQVIYAIAVSSATCKPEAGSDCGYDHFSYVAQDGCQIRHVTPGALGVLISQHCSTGDSLLLRDRYQSSDDTHDRIRWTVQDTAAVPVAADYFVAAVDPTTHRLTVYNRSTGKVQSSVTLNPPPTLTGPVSQTTVAAGELVQIGRTCYAFEIGAVTVRWAVATAVLPTADRDSERILYAPAAGGVDVLSTRTGQVTRTIPGPATTGARSLVRMGSGFLVSGSSTTTLH
jgi:outer membrane protein assembly factor BamB